MTDADETLLMERTACWTPGEDGAPDLDVGAATPAVGVPSMGHTHFAEATVVEPPWGSPSEADESPFRRPPRAHASPELASVGRTRVRVKGPAGVTRERRLALSTLRQSWRSVGAKGRVLTASWFTSWGAWWSSSTWAPSGRALGLLLGGFVGVVLAVPLILFERQAQGGTHAGRVQDDAHDQTKAGRAEAQPLEGFSEVTPRSTAHGAVSDFGVRQRPIASPSLASDDAAPPVDPRQAFEWARTGACRKALGAYRRLAARASGAQQVADLDEREKSQEPESLEQGYESLIEALSESCGHRQSSSVASPLAAEDVVEGLVAIRVRAEDDRGGSLSDVAVQTEGQVAITDQSGWAQLNVSQSGSAARVRATCPTGYRGEPLDRTFPRSLLAASSSWDLSLTCDRQQFDVVVVIHTSGCGEARVFWNDREVGSTSDGFLYLVRSRREQGAAEVRLEPEQSGCVPTQAARDLVFDRENRMHFWDSPFRRAPRPRSFRPAPPQPQRPYRL